MVLLQVAYAQRNDRKLTYEYRGAGFRDFPPNELPKKLCLEFPPSELLLLTEANLCFSFSFPVAVAKDNFDPVAAVLSLEPRRISEAVLRVVAELREDMDPC